MINRTRVRTVHAEIHWVGYDAASGEVVNWGSGSDLGVAVRQITKTRREYDGHVEVHQLARPFQQQRDMSAFQPRPAAERRAARVNTALVELESALGAVPSGGAEADELARLTRGAFARVRDMIWPGSRAPASP